MRFRCTLLLFSAAFLAFGEGASDPPKFRLPATASPVRYAIDLTVIPGEQTFHGSADIEFKTTVPAGVLWLSATDLKIDAATLRTGGSARAVKVAPGGDSFAGFTFDPPMPAGSGTLHVVYSGKIQSSSSAGIFQLRDGQNPDWYAYTQFEPTDARRAFPCFDEPHFKTPWQLTLHVKKDQLAAANSPIVSETDEAGGMKRVQFAATRPLPSYLVAFAVGPFDAVDLGKGGRRGIPLRILQPKGHLEESAYARM